MTKTNTNKIITTTTTVSHANLTVSSSTPYDDLAVDVPYESIASTSVPVITRDGNYSYNMNKCDICDETIKNTKKEVEALKEEIKSLKNIINDLLDNRLSPNSDDIINLRLEKMFDE